MTTPNSNKVRRVQAVKRRFRFLWRVFHDVMDVYHDAKCLAYCTGCTDEFYVRTGLRAIGSSPYGPPTVGTLPIDLVADVELALESCLPDSVVETVTQFPDKRISTKYMYIAAKEFLRRRIYPTWGYTLPYDRRRMGVKLDAAGQEVNMQSALDTATDALREIPSDE